MIKNMPEKTGKSLEEWFDLIKKRNLSTHSEIKTLIKGDHGVPPCAQALLIDHLGHRC